MRRAVVMTVSALALVAGLSVPAGARAGAVVIKDGMCGLLDGDGNMVMGTGSIHVTNSGGYEMLKCSVKNVANSTGRSVHHSFATMNMPCMLNGGSTEDWSEVVSASGNNNARAMLLRDVANVTATLGRFAPELLASRFGEEMWALYEQGLLRPDTALTGAFEAEDGEADVEGTTAAIEAAREEALRRRLAREEANLS